MAVDDGAVIVDFGAGRDVLLLLVLADTTSVPAVRSASLADGQFTALYLNRFNKVSLHRAGLVLGWVNVYYCDC